MIISRRIQPNCSEWNENVDELEMPYVDDSDVEEVIKKAKLITEWD